jgi:starvation-inducible DNA-binding protein
MQPLIDSMKVVHATTFAFYIKLHFFHWNVTGPDFAQYHEFLGDLYETIYGNVDIIAEKLRMLGVFAPTSLSRMLELSDIEESQSIPEAINMFRELEKDNERFIIHIRAGIVAADAANEPAISNFLQDLLDQHQKHAWMLRSLTK